jgi:1,4-dihydroxy-2-naphthoate octaprenyltransferase
MLVVFIRFYCTLFVRAFMPAEGEICLPDPDDAHTRRYTRAYRLKRGWVKNLWIGACLLMLCFPLVPFVLILALLTSFLSFAILDETA